MYNSIDSDEWRWTSKDSSAASRSEAEWPTAVGEAASSSQFDFVPTTVPRGGYLPRDPISNVKQLLSFFSKESHQGHEMVPTETIGGSLANKNFYATEQWSPKEVCSSKQLMGLPDIVRRLSLSYTLFIDYFRIYACL